MPATKGITVNKFQAILDFTRDCPVSVSAVKEPSTDALPWEEMLETESDDLAGYGVYITDKGKQSCIGSIKNELTRVENNLLWLEQNPEATGDAIKQRRDWIEVALKRAGQHKFVFDMFQVTQDEMLSAENIKYHTVEDADYDPDAWRPTEFALFEYREEEQKGKYKAEGYNTKSVNVRVALDKLIHERIAERLPNLVSIEPSEDSLYRYGKKVLKTVTEYIKRCEKKATAHFELGKDKLARDAKMRAKYLTEAGNGIHKVLTSAHELSTESEITPELGADAPTDHGQSY